jgi:Holliday junction resolvase RusA-like endonuclease
MPKSWSKKKKQAMDGKPHQHRPDLDNLVKAVLDAFFEEDKQIYEVRGVKFWKVKGSILISEIYD